jgi:hypothetical protein
MKRILFTFLLVTLVLIGTVSAVPPIPEEWYGSVFLNGNPAPAGTIITAQVNGESRVQITTEENGLYGTQTGRNDQGLFVTTTEDEMAKSPVTITFLVNGIQAFQAVQFEPGKLLKLDIYADSKAMPTAPPTISTASQGSTSGGISGPSNGGFPVDVPSATSPVNPQTTLSRSSVYNQMDNPGLTQQTTVVNTPAITTPVSSATQVPVKTEPIPFNTVLAAILIVAIILLAGVYIMKRRGSL